MNPMNVILTPEEQLALARRDYAQAELQFNLAAPGSQQDAAFEAMEEAKARLSDALWRARTEWMARKRSA